MEGGARDQVLHRTRVTESGPGDRPQLVRGVVLCTHSLVLAALPEARNYELGEWVLRPIEYDGAGDHLAPLPGRTPAIPSAGRPAWSIR
ncbi:hypothetical protein [Kocuria salsicia]|uniref:hypothetical protein n=1 Tax=Kocuria salsicia TaxID=664639 RepID=UPI00119F0003|nr:hypothetical protein [Kocuria salsicia]